MKIGIIQGTSQRDKNEIIEQCLREVVSEDVEIINFGVFKDDNKQLTYVQAALCISLLLESKAVDFIITGCSSGQGMMLACNSLPGVICGYAENVTDAYLFGRINNGNAISYPLGLNWGWTAEINLKETLKALFCEPLGNGYPPKDAKRKRYDSKELKKINNLCKKSLLEVLPLIDEGIVKAALNYDIIYDYIMDYGTNEELKALMKNLRDL